MLQYFLAVAREQSISAAAEYLHITQPTLSRQLRDMEEELGCQLLIRGNRRVMLTEQGMLLRKRAEEILELVHKAEDEMNISSDSVTGDITIGAGESGAFWRVAQLAREVQSRQTGIRFHTFSGEKAELMERLDKGLMDFAVLLGDVDTARYEAVPLPEKDAYLVFKFQLQHGKKDDVLMEKRTSVFVIIVMFVFCMCAGAQAEIEVFQEESTGEYGLKDGNVVLLPAEYYITETDNGLSYSIYDLKTKKLGFCDKASGFIQTPIYDELFDLLTVEPSYPMLVGNEGQYGYIDRTTGKVKIPLRYRAYCEYSEFVNGYAIIGETPPCMEWDDGYEQFVLIDLQGNTTIFPEGYIPFSHVADGTVVVYKRFDIIDALYTENIILYGLGTVDGRVLVEATYDFIGDFQEGYAPICRDGLWGHIDPRGTEVVKPMYKLNEEEQWEGYYFQNGIAKLCLEDGSVICIDYEGNIIR